MTHVPLSHFTKLEKESHKDFLSQIQSTQHKKFTLKKIEMPKHIYIIHGEPRTGKTTLGHAAALSMIGEILDTDQFENESVFEEVSQNVMNFLQKKSTHLYFIILGKHRRQNQILTNQIKILTKNAAYITICETSIP
jgi:hypothetical protein